MSWTRGLARGQARLLLSQALPARDDRVDVERVKFQAVTSPALAFRSEQSRTAAEKGVKDHVVEIG
jgi:hypothetical protein